VHTHHVGTSSNGDSSGCSIAEGACFEVGPQDMKDNLLNSLGAFGSD